MKKILRWMWIPVVLAFGYSGWVVYERRASSREIAEEAERKHVEADRQVIEKLGSGQLKILMFYANPPVVKRGEKGLLCYGVSNAASVRIEPNLPGVGPALSRCVEAEPKTNTEYTLVAKGSDGSEVSGKVEVVVK